MTQYIIVGLLVAAAVFFVARNMYKSIRGRACAEGNCGCEKKTFRKV
jgi:hypothetical protein